MFEKKATYIVTTALAVLNLWIYLSLNTLLAFVGFATFMAFPIILGVMQLSSAILCLVFTLHKPNKTALIVLFVENIIFFIFNIVLLYIFIGNITDIAMQGLKFLLIFIAIALVVVIIFYLPKWQFKYKKLVSILVCIAICLGIFVGFTDAKNLQINYIKQGAVVYAVGQDYQIVWTTQVKGTGYVQINGLTFYDTKAGSLVSEERVHKVSVPQAVLDTAKTYTVNTKTMISEQGFYATMGRVVKKTYSFRPVDESDGIQYFAISDSHDHNKVAAKTASYFGDKTDFVIMAGDIVSFLENDTDLSRILNLAYRMTKGKIPVVFARGNHELKSEKAEQLYRYVGSENGNFYYTFRLGSVWGVVLDMGEDHEDSWKEFFGTAQFDSYRKQQIDFLDAIIADSEQQYSAEGTTLRLGICHIPTAFTNASRDYMYADLVNLNSRLNQIGLDCMISGHLHQIFITENTYQAGQPLVYQTQYNGNTDTTPEFLATGASYYNIICSRSSRSQKDSVKLGKYFSGVAFEQQNGEFIIKFVNNKKEIISTISPFEDRNYGKEFILS